MKEIVSEISFHSGCEPVLCSPRRNTELFSASFSLFSTKGRILYALVMFFCHFLSFFFLNCFFLSCRDFQKILYSPSQRSYQAHVGVVSGKFPRAF